MSGAGQTKDCSLHNPDRAYLSPTTRCLQLCENTKMQILKITLLLDSAIAGPVINYIYILKQVYLKILFYNIRVFAFFISR